MVPKAFETSRVNTHPNIQASCNTAKPSHARTVTEPEVETICLETLWQSRALQEGWSIRAASRLRLGWAQSTVSTYNSCLSKMQVECSKLDVKFPPYDAATLAECLLSIASTSTRLPRN